ncbi:MAG: hypothetical protein AAFX05_00600 [Planctomycetota bacterium]
MKTVIALCAVAGMATSASGQLIAADSYDIPPYADAGLNGQNPSVTPGWTSGNAWSVGSANLQADLGTLTNSATTYDDASTGKGQYIASSFDFFRRGFRTVDAYAAADTYYMSFFVNPGGAFLGSGSREHAVVGFTNFFGQGEFENAGGSANVFGLFAGFRGEDAGAAPGEADLILRARGGSGDLEDTVLLANAQSTTYHVMYRVDVNAVGGQDNVTYWVNPSDLSSEAQATATALATGTVGTFSMNTNSDIIQKHVLTNKWARSFFWDETRFGYDFASVAIPAPGAAAVLGLAGLAGLRRRR